MKVAKRKLTSQALNHNNPQSKNSKVFIVHGHDEEAQLKTAQFIDKLGLIPIILHDQASFGGTIIEKIELHTNVKFAIVLYTPCDIGGKKIPDPDFHKCASIKLTF